MPLTGSSQEIPLVDVVQVAANNRQTCRIAVWSMAGEGDLFLDRGELVHATCGSQRGEEAAYLLLGSGAADYSIEAGVVAGQRTIHVGCQHLVLEAARRLDESARLGPRVRASAAASAATSVSVTAPTEMVEPAPPLRSVRARRSPWWRLPVLTAAAMTLLLGGVALARWVVPPPAPATVAPAVTAIATEVTPIAASTVEASILTGVGDAMPIALETPSPSAPVASALAPTISCRILVDELGAVRDAKVYRSRLDLAVWEDAALDAVARWQFAPARRGGAPVAAWLNVPVGFVPLATARIHITIKGSDTIGGEHGVGPGLAAAYQARHLGIEVTWEGLGSSTAFVGLLDGSADVGASSRAINARELAEAERLGVTIAEYVLGYDGIAIVVHPDAPVASITIDQAARIFTGELTSWADLGGADLPIRRISRPSYSGTHTFFRDKVLRGGDAKRPEDFAVDTEWIEATEQIVAEVAADPTAIAYVSVGWMRPTVKAVPIATSDLTSAIAPSVETVRDGSYPIYRPLLLYVRGPATPEVVAFLRYCLSAEAQALLADHGFVPGDLPLDQLAAVGRGGDSAVAVAPALAVRISFASGRSTLDRTARRALWALAASLRESPRRILVVGHADAGGAAGGNAAVARRRAQVVADYLRRAGVDPSRLAIESSGADAPIASNTSGAGRHQNRRVDVLVAP